MSKEEAIRMLKAKLECMTRDVSGRDSDCINRRCDECPLNYEQGNMGEQKEWLRMAIEALKLQPNEEFTEAPQPNTEHIIKDTIKEYLDKKFDDVTELLLALSKDLCERIKHEDEKATATQLKTKCSRKENKPRLSKPAFTVIDHVLKEHEEHEDRFTTFCDGRHQQITVKQINAELDKLYNYFYGKGEESGEGTK